MYALQWENKIVDKVENHGIYRTENDAINAVFDWWELNDFKPYYIRKFYRKDGVEVLDYGSHDFFYLITKINKDNFGEVLGREKV